MRMRASPATFAVLVALLQVASAADICLSRTMNTCTLDSQCGFCSWNAYSTISAGSACMAGGPDGANPNLYPNQCCDTWVHKDGATGRQKKCSGSDVGSEDCSISCQMEVDACKNDRQCLSAHSCIDAKEAAVRREIWGVSET